MSLRRPTVVFLLKPFMWCRLDAWLWHAFYLFTFRGVASDTRSVFIYFFIWISGGLPPDFLFIFMSCKFIIWVCIANCSWCIMFTLSSETWNGDCETLRIIFENDPNKNFSKRVQEKCSCCSLKILDRDKNQTNIFKSS